MDSEDRKPVPGEDFGDSNAAGSNNNAEEDQKPVQDHINLKVCYCNYKKKNKKIKK